MLRVKITIDVTNMLHLPNLFSNIKTEVLNSIDKYIHLEMNFQFASLSWITFRRHFKQQNLLRNALLRGGHGSQ